MQVGTIVKLKVACLGNPAGALGVVFYDYGDGCQVIFENGNLDGFHTVEDKNLPPSWNTKIEFDFFLERAGYEPSVAGYQFKNVLQVEQDFRNGIFDIALKKGGGQ